MYTGFATSVAIGCHSLGNQDTEMKFESNNKNILKVFLST